MMSLPAFPFNRPILNFPQPQAIFFHFYTDNPYFLSSAFWNLSDYQGPFWTALYPELISGKQTSPNCRKRRESMGWNKQCLLMLAWTSPDSSNQMCVFYNDVCFIVDCLGLCLAQFFISAINATKDKLKLSD